MKAIERVVTVSLLLLTVIQLLINILFYQQNDYINHAVYDYVGITFYQSLILFIICLLISSKTKKLLPVTPLAFGQLLMVPLYRVLQDNDKANTNIQIIIAVIGLLIYQLLYNYIKRNNEATGSKGI